MNHLAPVFVLALILAIIASREHGSFALPQLGRLNESDEDGAFTILIVVLAAVLVTGVIRALQ